ncbi:MAG: SDR family oxidoreductase [Desulfobulbus sp.]|uniref:SDR family NAD(P)-dependent oxidoreductase n=1 Tax=Desulfobulbus sp. TaxID=895 RepID=UPI0028460873|nr:SDR family oxidoreductase [Desulfobulbus sp.]MDR2549428.1 SDR family oxidoreductase [Desulfobulbus sp.]
MIIAGKRALVLGATRGIGRAVARNLASQGVRLILPWLDWPESVAELREEFGGGRDGHLLVRTDLRLASEVAELMAVIDERFGRLEIVVNNIERGGMPVLHGGYGREVNRDQWRLEMETTLHAKWLVFDQALPLLRRSEAAAVVNISSIAGMVGRSGPAGFLFNDGYAAANRGVSSLTETWARIGAPTIRVNELMLGLIDSRHGPGTRGWDLLSEEQRRDLLHHTLLRRTGTPEEVARAVLFLIRDADFLTGSVLRLDGGYMVGGEAPAVMPDGSL